MTASDIEHTYIGKIGKIIAPAIEPLGFDWRIGVALTTGFAAKEIIVSTLGTIYSVGENTEGNEHESLMTTLRNDPDLNPVKAYGLMLFILIYVPWHSGSQYSETGSGWLEMGYYHGVLHNVTRLAGEFHIH